MRYRKSHIITFITLLAFIASAILLPGQNRLSYADTISELQQKIKERNDALAQLQQEINQYQSQVDATGKQANNLTNTLTSLELTRKKLLKDIEATQNKIGTTNLLIEKLQLDIGDKEERIDKDKQTISQTFRKLDIEESKSLVQTLLEFDDLSQFWNELQNLTRLQASVKANINDLQNTKKALEDNKNQTEVKKNQLVDFTDQLKGQTQAVEMTKQEKKSLLAQTKDQQANYQKLLEQKLAAKKAFEDDLANLESQLRLTVNPNSLPPTGSGVLQWPLDKVRITQYFGNTAFATANPQAYHGKGHNGIDLAAAIGTPIKAARSGTVVEIGDTGILPTCFSYGKWVLIRHDNGLSTLYGHLSAQLVQAGQHVNTGDIIAYSGATGYVTGPHLHFTVFATEGVQVVPLVNSVNCKNVRVPAAAQTGYLNPL